MKLILADKILEQRLEKILNISTTSLNPLSMGIIKKGQTQKAQLVDIEAYELTAVVTKLTKPKGDEKCTSIRSNPRKTSKESFNKACSKLIISKQNLS